MFFCDIIRRKEENLGKGVKNMENAIMAIVNSNLTAEQKDALLRELANESIKKQQNQNSFEAKRAKLVEKERQKAKETRERLEKYQKEAYRKEIIKNSKAKALEYINELAKIKNNHGEYIYKDLEKEYKDGKITEAEIYALYERINNNKMYEDLFKKLDENPVQDVADNNESQNIVSLEEAADKMTTDEMNTILNMFASQTKDENVLDEIANRLRVNKDSLEEIAKLKEENLKENENITKSNDDNEQNNEEEKDKDIEQSSFAENNKENSSSYPVLQNPFNLKPFGVIGDTEYRNDGKPERKIVKLINNVKDKISNLVNKLNSRKYSESSLPNSVMGKEQNINSNEKVINKVLGESGLEMPVNTFAEDNKQALEEEESQNPAEMMEEENKSQADKISDIAGFEMPVNTFAENNKPVLEEEESQNPAEMKEEENKSQADNILNIAGLEMPVNTFNQGSSKNR